MKHKILITTLLLPIASAIAPITSCSKTKEKATITFTATQGVTLEGQTTITVVKGTTLKNVVTPTYKIDDQYYFYGWLAGEVILNDDFIINDNITITCAARPKSGKGLHYECYTSETGEKTAKIFQIWSTAKDIVLPDKIYKNNEAYTVTEVGGDLFGHSSTTETLVLPHTITTMPDFFRLTNVPSLKMVRVDCNNPTFTSRDDAGNEINCIINKNTHTLSCATCVSEELKIPQSIVKIADKAFYDNSFVKKVVLSNGFKEIGQNAFEKSALQSINLVDSIEKIDYKAFASCMLDEVTLPRNNVQYGMSVFEENVLTKLVITKENKKIPNSFCNNCSFLKELTIENGVEELGVAAFASCESLQSCTIPESVTKCGSGLFEGCTSLTEINISCNMPVIESYMFAECPLKKVIIPEGVTTIGSSAFAQCPIEELEIPSTVTTIGMNAFAWGSNDKMSKLTKIKIAKNNTKYTSRDSKGNECNVIQQISDGKIILGCATSTIPDTTKIIGQQSFGHVGEGLSTLNITSNTESIEIESKAFQQAKIPNITIGKNVTAIENDAFFCADNRQDLKVDPNNTIFTSQDSDGNEQHCIMNKDRTIIRLASDATTVLSTITKFDTYSFSNTHFTNFTIPNTIANISNYAFYGCDSLQKVIFPSTSAGMRIGPDAFSYCKKLNDLRFNVDVSTSWPEEWSNGAFTVLPASGTIYFKSVEGSKTNVLQHWSQFSQWTFKEYEEE